MTLTDRVSDNSAWVFSVTPSSVSVPAAGGQYAFSVVSYFNPGEIGQGHGVFAFAVYTGKSGCCNHCLFLSSFS